KLEDGIRALAQPELLNRYLSLRLSVTQYRLAGESRYRDEASLASAELRTTLEADTAPADTKRLVPLLDQYEAAFNELVRLDGEIRHHTDLYNTAAATIQPLTLGIAADGAALASENLNSMAESVQRARTGLALSITVVVMLSLLLTITLSRQISRPLRALTDAVIQIGRGNLNAPLPKAGHDEVGILTTTFHDMVSQLRESFATLEQRVADRTRALALSSEISRRLSGVLDQKQLISEVVEQVRSSFNYYHVHIYLYDPKHEYWVMSGGTGEAARAMLARGHRIEQGRGLVGRAGGTNAPVLVPDVAKDPGWLPNPLLPDTKAEVAVPIAIGGRVLGVLDVQHNVREGLKQDDVELLQSIAFQVAIALQNARSYELAQRQADRETFVNTISRRIQSAGDVESVLQIAARELGQALDAQRATIQVGMTKLTDTRRS
ncbi:MAG TPA: GAF domain-containing protein, partial [Anaerolineales bacterium]|nr:GAF domain-containing protein [Anaerolineales bacterium]